LTLAAAASTLSTGSHPPPPPTPTPASNIKHSPPPPKYNETVSLFLCSTYSTATTSPPPSPKANLINYFHHPSIVHSVIQPIQPFKQLASLFILFIVSIAIIHKYLALQQLTHSALEHQKLASSTTTKDLRPNNIPQHRFLTSKDRSSQTLF